MYGTGNSLGGRSIILSNKHLKEHNLPTLHNCLLVLYEETMLDARTGHDLSPYFFSSKICLKSVLFCIFYRCKGAQYFIFDGKHCALAILAPLRNFVLYPFHLTEDVTGCLVLTPGENYLRKAELHKQYQTEYLCQ